MSSFRTLILVAALSALLAPATQAEYSAIVQVDGFGCAQDQQGANAMQTAKAAALADARRTAAANARTTITSTTVVKNYVAESDVIEAVTEAEVRIHRVFNENWDHSDACYTLSAQAEVIPADDLVSKASLVEQFLEDPTAPLTVKLWTNKSKFNDGDTMRIYLKGNKSFYARVVYKNVGGDLLQVLPNPKRDSNYFEGGVIYTIPGGEDAFDLQMTPPFGSEQLTVYASTNPLGEVNQINLGNAVYQLPQQQSEVSRLTRGMKINYDANSKNASDVAEFNEQSIDIVVAPSNKP